MKQIVYSLFMLVLLSLYSCHPRKSVEEGELFLFSLEKRTGATMDTDSLIAYNQCIFAAEQQYDFTVEQLLRLKQYQLYWYKQYDKELTKKIITEAEALALQTKNDSLICKTRKYIFLCYQRTKDTTAVLEVLKLQEPLVRSLEGPEGMNPYYLAIAVIYKEYNQWEQSLRWYRKARPQKFPLAPWYQLMAETLMKAGHYDDAILYADSALLTQSNKLARANSSAWYIKGESLLRLGRIRETGDWYAHALQILEPYVQTSGKESYSINQYTTIYYYTSFLRQQGRLKEAAAMLEKTQCLSSITQNIQRPGFNSSNHILINLPRLLTECYLGTGQMDKATHSASLADSIQQVLIHQRDLLNSQKRGEQQRSAHLTGQLSRQEQEAATARFTQRLLWTVIAVLLTVIVAGLLWWKQHRKRLRQLFDTLLRHHAEWQTTQSLTAPEEIQPQEIETETYTLGPHAASSEMVSINHKRLYQKVLLIMKNQQPFLDPAFDLITLARLAATNRTLLSTALNQQAHMNFSNWLAEYRINYLIEQMELFDRNDINDLFSSVGYTSRSTFYRQFRQVTGLTPRQYMAERKL